LIERKDKTLAFFFTTGERYDADVACALLSRARGGAQLAKKKG
jgi:hypothetical protein